MPWDGHLHHTPIRAHVPGVRGTVQHCLKTNQENCVFSNLIFPLKRVFRKEQLDNLTNQQVRLRAGFSDLAMLSTIG